MGGRIMGGKPATWWIMLAAGIFAAAFLLKDFMDHGHAILAHAGYKGLLTSPTIHHKIGEALIGVILFMTALMRSIWTPERLIANLKASYPLMLVGAALNALAWFGSGLPATDFNKIWFVLLVVVGIAAPPLLIRWFGQSKGTQAQA
ncbi:hypothetical protein [Caulobacter vibrioides]|uniref:Uncharacterized protein n=2 Tax=Caulobacter vibrioides TaxID=155892 RepID=Q9A6G4_CAUVC|nr:hypothetical protein [Caulobacter vibrioides]YP_002517587.1 hypothetical protein CCNA_02214 [Caulobacter vibrioides NA1000]AAK24101.1 hypothetical protein CC_2130 [Caulobacter vibrioides CB15]ACL95679.1 hypothetical protein CCNA_02214 [Caulobacter vibrioides NA1000]ATC29000.1 hypothetical protein CA607_11610 [Caulobacter vibrioides]QXZ50513.1 hypothetical protein KZH45_11365 [Caulobacter vibrioides]